MNIQTVIPASGEPVTAALAKAHCRITSSLEDALVDHWITAAREYAEIYMGRPIRAATYRATAENPDPQIIIAGLGSFTVSSVNAVTGAASVLVPSTEYQVSWDYQQMVIDGTWPTADRIEVNFTAGWADVPRSIIQALLLFIGDMNENREAQALATGDYKGNPAAHNLLHQYRVLGV